MRISTTTDIPCKRFGWEGGIRAIAEAGFDCVDLSMFELNSSENPINQPDYADFARTLRSYAEKYGIEFNQAHAPFPSWVVEDRNGYNDRIKPGLRRAIEIAGIIGAKQIIIHPSMIYFGRKQYDFNMEYYNSLVPELKKAGVRAALENMFGWNPTRREITPIACSFGGDFKYYMEALDPEYFTACVDIGHAGLVGGKAGDMLRTLGKYVGALHVHDNDGKRDMHTCPFSQSIDWSDVCAALRDIDYPGDITLESDSFMYGFPPELVPAGLRLLHDAAAYIRDSATRR